MVGISSFTMSWAHVLALNTVLLEYDLMTADDVRKSRLQVNRHPLA